MRKSLLSVAVTAGCGVIAIAQGGPVSEASRLQGMAARFAPTDIRVDLAKVSASDKKVLAKLVEASKIMDAIFLRQVWVGNDAMLIELSRDQTLEGRARLHNFLINKGPWDRLDHNKPFVPGAPAKPAGANYYPEGAAKADIDAWMKSLPEAERARATGFFTVVHRNGNAFSLVPYNVAYHEELTRAAALLRDAAALTTEPTLKNFLTRRAAAFLSDDYYDSDVAWMELKGAIEPTIGPYEVYEDEYFNFKAGFEAFITVQDEEESAKLQKFAAELQDIENNLPIDPKYRNPTLGGLAPIVVVNEVFAAGDANRGVQTAAFNLPNDERVVQEKGAKRVMLKNVQDAKFAKTLMPISKVVLSPADQKNVAFDAFFAQILVHELMHGLGPSNITVNGRKTTVRQEIKEAYGYLEEAKADISGLFAIQHMIDKGVMPKALEKTLYTTYLASVFRSIRFGVAEAHGRGVAVQFNYLLDAGAFIASADGTFRVDLAKVKAGVTGLTRDIMTIQAEGDYAKAIALRDRLGVVRPVVQRALDRMKAIPVDIEPRFTTAAELLKASR